MFAIVRLGKSDCTSVLYMDVICDVRIKKWKDLQELMIRLVGFAGVEIPSVLKKVLVSALPVYIIGIGAKWRKER